MSRLILILCATLILVLACAASALAWGPGVHLAAGNFFLARLDLLSPMVAHIISANPRAFLYGCLSADIFIGKGTRFTPGHSHNWSTGFKLLLDSAQDLRLAAYAYGYLSHLAADTIAHNYYIPTMLARTPSGGKLSHVYLELQADWRMPWSGREARALLLQPNGEADACLRDATDQPRRLPFLLKKGLYTSGFLLYDTKSWRRSLRFMGKALPGAQDDETLADMIDLSMRVVGSVLNNPTASPATALDPIGSRNLSMAQRRRHRLRGFSLARRRARSFPVDERLARLPRLG
jgi:hypothetical protein